MIKFTRQLLILLLFCGIIVAQDSEIRGFVFAEGSLKPIAQANIAIKSTDFGTASSEDGEFSFSWYGDFPIILVITHIGYEMEELTIDAPNTSFEIFLKQKVLLSGEIIIEGRKKYSEKEVTSKVETLSVRESIEQRGIRDISELLSEAEGIVVNTSTFGEQTISIRGSNSNEVAVYLDGIKINNLFSGIANLADIDLTELENIDVIKGSASTLFGSGNFGGVVLLRSRRPELNSIEVGRSIGLTEKSDQDESGALSLKYGPVGLYGRYSGKSRMFDGRTLFTSIFNNIGGLLTLRKQEVLLAHLNHEKYIKYPSGGGIISSDKMWVDQMVFSGDLFMLKDWDIQAGRKNWEWEDNFFSNINQQLKENTILLRINKGFRLNSFSGSLQWEEERQLYESEKQTVDQYSSQNWKSFATLEQIDRGVAGVLRYDAINPVENVDLLRWEFGIRNSNAEFIHDQIAEEYNDTSLVDIKDYYFNDNVKLTTYRLGMLAEGNFQGKRFQLFFNQGFNNRAPSLNDRFIWADGLEKIKVYYRTIEFIPIYQDQKEQLERIIEQMESGIEKESVTTTELNSEILFEQLDNKVFGSVKFGLGIFRNSYLNKITYAPIGYNLVVPYNAKIAWLNGIELNSEIMSRTNLFRLTGNITWIKPSDQDVFPEKPSTMANIIFDLRKDWFHLNVSHIYQGPQNYIHGGVTAQQLEDRRNTNLTVSVHKQVWYFDATLSYTIRNLFSDEITYVDAGSNANDIFNYYDAHRQIIYLKLSLADKK
ncbi:MAG: TonB-dependent receptor [Candidatus Neomarinimicrobiota bacterium]